MITSFTQCIILWGFFHQLTLAAWPTNVFAPYIDVTFWPTNDVSQLMTTTGVKHYTLAFIVSDADRSPSWGGYYKTSTNYYGTQIANLRSQGGDVICSFGGAAGYELALNYSNVTELTSVYQSVINQYQFTWLDFDIEGGALPNTTVNDLRNQAIKNLQTANPGLRISYTLPVVTSGLTAPGVALLQSAKTYGVQVDVVNIMAMDYYNPSIASSNFHFIKCIAMGANALQAAQNTLTQLQSLGLTSKVGVTPMVFLS